MKYLIFFALLVVCRFQGNAQHESPVGTHSLEGTHRLTMGLAHTHISNGRIHDKTEWIASPSWALNYDYWLSDKWAIGLQNDLIMEIFVVENVDEEEIERKYPFAIVPVVVFKPGKHFYFIGGVGKEYAEGGNLTLTRLGAEYGLLLPGKWKAGVALVWDNAWDHYNSWGFAFTLSKLISKKD